MYWHCQYRDHSSIQYQKFCSAENIVTSVLRDNRSWLRLRHPQRAECLQNIVRGAYTTFDKLHRELVKRSADAHIIEWFRGVFKGEFDRRLQDLSPAGIVRVLDTAIYISSAYAIHRPGIESIAA
jgi:hypothetical protein